MIGCGCPDPMASRYGSAYILEVGKDLIMIDCGPATTFKMAKMGIRAGMVEYLFFTHHHFDHNADFPCFALTRWDTDNGSLPPLKVYGPAPTRKFVDLLVGENGAFAPDIRSRIEHPASQGWHLSRGGVLPRPGMNIETHDIDAGKIMETASWTVRAVRVPHVEPGLISLAYRFDTREGSVLFTGDCSDCRAFKELAGGVDTLVANCTRFGNVSASETPKVIAGTTDVAEIVKATGAGRVILTHSNAPFCTPDNKEKAIQEIAKSCDGDVFFPEELTTIEI